MRMCVSLTYNDWGGALIYSPILLSSPLIILYSWCTCFINIHVNNIFMNILCFYYFSFLNNDNKQLKSTTSNEKHIKKYKNTQCLENIFEFAKKSCRILARTSSLTGYSVMTLMRFFQVISDCYVSI